MRGPSSEPCCAQRGSQGRRPEEDAGQAGLESAEPTEKQPRKTERSREET